MCIDNIEERKAYFEKLLQDLKEGGQFIVIDFFNKGTPQDPPVEMRISARQVQEELKTACFSRFELNETLRPYQYILRVCIVKNSLWDIARVRF